jgi:transcriptional regulator with XRE-family HTH domain
MEYTELGPLIKSEREKRAWEQADLASRVSVKQQTVSRWEKGDSRPRRDDLLKLVDLFSGDTYEWLAKAGYDIEGPDTSLTPYLPLQNLSEEKFEFFCQNLIQALNPDYEVQRYGSRGHKQNGIDLYARKSSSVFDYQCKRHKQFGPSDIREAILNTTFTAEHHYLILSRSATPRAQDEILKHPDWSLWDREFISAKVRNLPTDRAIRLVDIYFPGKRKSFLGLDEPSPWLTPEEFYLPLADRLKLFSHGWKLVGRQKELELLKEFEEQSKTQAILLSGRGGIGKSRLLKAWVDGISKSIPVRFVSNISEVKPKDIESLIRGPSFLVIDDAHERADILEILNGVARTRPEMKIVVSSRPYGISRLMDGFTKFGLSYDLNKIITLNDLTLEDARALAKDIISSIGGNIKYAYRIAEITKDCPLATVVGSRLVGEGKIKPELLINDKRFREELLSRFRDVVAGEVGGSNAALVCDLLDFLVMVQPFNPSDPKFKEAAEKLLERHFDKIIRDVTALEEAGVLLSRGNHLRVVPDLLADYIRNDAAYDERNKQPTGYADRVFRTLQDELATNLLVNISQLDWRISADGAQTSILKEIWAYLKKQFKQAKVYERSAILDAIKKVSYYQPSYVMDFIWIALEEPTYEIEADSETFIFTKPSYKTVIEKIPPILRDVAYNINYLIQALDLLKQLAEEDERPTNQYPDHPIRVLKDLASIEPGKPAIINELIAEHAIKWLQYPAKGKFSPFDILDQLLQTEGHQSEVKGFTVTMKPFKVIPEAVAELRQRIVRSAFEVVETRPLYEAMRALKTLEAALSYPMGVFGQDITSTDRAAWDPSILIVLHGLEIVVLNQKLDPLITVEVRRAVTWLVQHGSEATKDAAKKVLLAIPNTLDYELSRAVADGWGWTFEGEDGRPGYGDKVLIEWRKELARKLIKQYNKNPSELISLIEDRINQIKNAQMSQHTDAGQFLGVVMEDSFEFTELLGKHLLDYPSSPIVDWFGLIVSVMAKHDRSASISIIKSALQKDEKMLTRGVTVALGWGANNLPVIPEEIEILRKLAESTDPWVRRNIVRAVKRFTTEYRAVGLDILLSIDITDSKEIADEVLGEFDERYGSYKTEDLSDQQLHQLLNYLLKCPSIDDYHINIFLSNISFTHPTITLKLLTDRVEYKEKNDKLEAYDPLPDSSSRREPLRFHETSQYEQILRIVRNWANVKTGSWIRFNYGKDLFKLISSGFNNVTLIVLEEWIMSEDQNQLEAAAALLSEAENAFVWENQQFVTNILERAQKYGSNCYQRVSSSLYGSVIQGGRSGIPGQPFPEDIIQRDRSFEIMSDLPPGSPAQRFYKMLYDEARIQIERHTYDEFDEI